jgi:adenylate cyclase
VPTWAPATGFFTCLLAGILVSTMFVVASGIYPLVAGSVLTCAVLITASATVFLHSGRFVSVAAPVLLVAALFIAFVLIRFAFEKRRAYLRQRQLENARQVTIEAMASVAETRDPETGAHIKRTQHYVQAVALELRRSGHYTDILTDEYIRLLFLSAPLHDIGKVGVPDYILLKPGRLTADEMTQMKLHAEFGRKIIHSTAARIDGDNFLNIAAEIAATHHEKWDGSGYPLGLAGHDIPLSGRIMAVADIYDALISRRCYKEPFPHRLAMTLLQEDSGKTFDPVVVDAFLRIEDTVKEIAERFKDDETEITEGPAALTARLLGSLTNPAEPAAPMVRVTAEMARDRAM